MRDFDEFTITRKSWKDSSKKGPIKFLNHYREFVDGTETINLYSSPAVESLRPVLVTNTVGWDMDVPDVFLNTAGDLTLLPKVLDAASRFTRRPPDDEMGAMLASTRMTSLFGLPS